MNNSEIKSRKYIKETWLFVIFVCTISLLISLVATHFYTKGWPKEYYDHSMLRAFLLPLIITPIAALFVQRLLLRNHEVLLKVEQLANMDYLTGLVNRRAFMVEAAARLGTVTRQAVLIGDIDFFKRVNDTYGHAAGDEALRHVSKILSANAPKDSVIARIGGEEFAVLFNWTSFDDAQQIAERFRCALERSPCYYEGHKIYLTMSSGLVVGETPDNIDKLLLRADAALYRAKHNGRNQTLLAA